jgi:hypothetical protein
MAWAEHSDRDVHGGYNHPAAEAHRQAAEQVAALVEKAGSRSCSRTGVPQIFSGTAWKAASQWPQMGSFPSSAWVRRQGTRTPNPRIKSLTGPRSDGFMPLRWQIRWTTCIRAIGNARE